jgi:hypothetical protein
MEKIMLITGCSHAAGSEIDGTQDSDFNRSNSFGNLLARKMGYRPINIASLGSTNNCISRTTLEWFSKFYDPNEMEIFVLVAWTESSRIEVPTDRDCYYNMANKNAAWNSPTSTNYFRINLGYTGGNDEEKVLFPKYHKFMAENMKFLELAGLNLALQLQYFFKSLNVKYLMCNTMSMFENDRHTSFYFNLLDKNRYLEPSSSELSFYWYYKNLGYQNIKAKYWHHGEDPHRLYSEKLFKFIN